MRVTRPLAIDARDPLDPIDRMTLERYLTDVAVDNVHVLVVIPAYNEADALPSVLESMPTQLDGVAPTILVVSDGSTDQTRAVALAHGALCCETPINRGQGAALRLGYLIALRLGADYIGVIDADGQWAPEGLVTGLAYLTSGKADFVQGSRVLGSTDVGDPIRDLGVKVFAMLISRLTGVAVTDTSSGLRLFTTKIAARIRLDQPQYQSSELLIAAAFAGARIQEFPVAMTKRVAGHSKKAANLLYGLYYMRAAIRTYLRERWIAPS
ncbi:MAG: glycosyltransferase family 2 protein [Ferrimicrobium sp.]|jgi:glycosyltransferase involved in cell wall biosynthesis|uniref:glycosyltransferase family 2 protein n=1 Tax=Ferrimicrobium sp. TaxID=2926050 RepID=UPI00262C3879|nr:glycosyltransferase family 2 protein [Ferrimicrobium sp.]